MKQTASVVLRDGKLMAEVVRSEACQSCHACKFGQQEKVYVALPKSAGKFSAGDKVDIELDDARFSVASIIAYGVPVAMFLLGLFIAAIFTSRDYVLAISALGAMAIGLIIIKLYDKRIRRTGRYAPRISACQRTEEK